MLGIVFHMKVKPGRFDEFIEFLRWDAQICKEDEPDTLRFEFYPDPQDDHGVYVYEAYANHKAFEAHKKHNAAYQKWNAGYADEIGEFTLIFGDEALGSTLE